ncbi:MAG: phosphatase PAP2 family protein, partial [Pseudomonadota bacterium]
IMTVISMQDWRSRSLSTQKMLVRAYERAAFIFFAIAIPGILINIAKQLIGRGRPRTFDEYGAYVFSPFEFTHQFQSFPSGHATTAGSLGMIVALYFPNLRWPALILAGVIAFARVPAKAHYLSDVLAGYLIGTLATLLIARWLASRATTFKMNPSALFPQLKR